MITITCLSPQQLRRAADLLGRNQSLEAEPTRLLGAEATALARPATVEAPGQSKKRKVSAAGRPAIAAVAWARWAKAPAAPAVTAKPKISAAGRTRLAALARERWAKVERAGKKRQGIYNRHIEWSLWSRNFSLRSPAI
jgi:hypothetical protein